MFISKKLIRSDAMISIINLLNKNFDKNIYMTIDEIAETLNLDKHNVQGNMSSFRSRLNIEFDTIDFKKERQRTVFNNKSKTTTIRSEKYNCKKYKLKEKIILCDKQDNIKKHSAKKFDKVLLDITSYILNNNIKTMKREDIVNLGCEVCWEKSTKELIDFLKSKGVKVVK